MLRLGYFFFVLLLLSSSCKSSKNLSTVESHSAPFVMPELKSTINLHYKIKKNATRDTFNNIIDQYLNSDIQISALGMDVNLKKYGLADVEISGKRVLSRLPIEIGISKETFIKNIKAKGILDLNFLTDLEIDSSWNLLTETKLEHYEWLEEPKIDLGGFTISIEKLSNTVIEKSKAQLEEQINLSINEQLSIRDKVLDVMKYLEKPIEVDTIMQSWVHLIPEQVYMSQIRNEEDWSRGNLTVHTKTKITDHNPNEVIPGLKLPDFSWEEELDDTSHINIVMDVNYENINGYLKQNFVGQTFSNDGKNITIEDIHLRSSGDKLVADAKVSGSFNGDLQISGKPIFDNDKEAFYTEDIDVQVKTKNILHKAGAWIAKGKIKNKLQKLLYFSISDNLNAVQEKVNNEVGKYSKAGQLDLKADIKRVMVNKFVLSPDKIHAFVTLNVYLEAAIQDMRVFNPEPTQRLKTRNP